MAELTVITNNMSESKYLIDFHTHILPGMDDGAKDVEESLWLLRQEALQGVDEVFLTPHFYASQNSPMEFLKRRNQSWKNLSACLEPGLPALRLGAEVQYFDGICSVEEIRHLRIVGTNLLLLEMPFSRWTDRIISNVIELNGLWGLQVVLAHIERYMPMQTDAVWERLRAYGVWMQSNISFFENWRTKRKAASLLTRGQIQFMGSDCHDRTVRCPKWDRVPNQVKNVLMTNSVSMMMQGLNTDGVHLEYV